MRKIALAAAAAASLALAPSLAASAAAQQALQAGSYQLGGSAGITLTDGPVGENLFRIAGSPRVLYFVSDGLALGAEVGASYTKQGESSGTSFGLGPAASYYFVRDGRVQPFVRASASWFRSSFDNPVGADSSDDWAVAGGAGLLFMLSEAVGIDAELYVSRYFYESPLGDTFDATIGGLRFGVSAFVL